jgi:zinc protease
MKKIYFTLIGIFIAGISFAQIPANTAKAEKEIVELKIPKSGKAIIRLMFRNGSISDPAGKEGLTNITADMIVESGTSTMTSTQIRELTYPWSARMSGFVDKECVVL